MPEFVPVARLSDLKPNSLKQVKAGDQEIALANVAGEVFAISDVCTHAHCPLSEGELDGDRVICPCHGSEFNVRTGAVENPPADEPVATYAVRVEGDQILVAV